MLAPLHVLITEQWRPWDVDESLEKWTLRFEGRKWHYCKWTLHVRMILPQPPTQTGAFFLAWKTLPLLLHYSFLFMWRHLRWYMDGDSVVLYSVQFHPPETNTSNQSREIRISYIRSLTSLPVKYIILLCACSCILICIYIQVFY